MVMLFASSFLLAAVVTGWMRRYALRSAMLDIPNERSSHTVPTPRGGGLSIAVVWLPALPLLWGLDLLEGRVAVALGGGGVLIAGVGWIDDRADLSVQVRLAAQVAAAAWAVAWLGGAQTLDIGLADVQLGWAGAVLAALGIVWLTNLYNFMDGLDGLAGVEALTAGTTAALILSAADARGLAAVAGVLAATAAGFLLWNWPPAKIFMGDVGSGLLGYAFAVLALAAERTTSVPGLVVIIPLLVFITDATYTLARRMARGERVYAAHRSHIYQRLVQQGWSHRQVTSVVFALNVLLGVVAWVVSLYPELLPWLFAATLLGLVALAWRLIAWPFGRSVWRRP